MNVELTRVATNRELRPYQPTLAEAERLMDEGSNGVDVPVATNDSGAEQDENEFTVFTALEVSVRRPEPRQTRKSVRMVRVLVTWRGWNAHASGSREISVRELGMTRV